MVQKGRTSIFLLLVIITFLTTSCRKFKDGQTVPSYIKVESFEFNSYYLDEGTDSHDIFDVWVYVDDIVIGAFELPALVPILKEGIHKLELRPGIQINGIAETRSWYPLYRPSTFENFNLVKDSVIEVFPSTTYFENIEYVWMEDFESTGITFESSSSTSDTVMFKTESNDPNVFEGFYSGKIVLDTANKTYLGTSIHEYELPQNGSPIFLELNFKTNNTVVIGVKEQRLYQTYQKSLLNLNPKEVWQKIYINLTKAVVEANEALDFKIFIGAYLDEGIDKAEIYIDNVKLVYRTNQ